MPSEDPHPRTAGTVETQTNSPCTPISLPVQAAEDEINLAVLNMLLLTTTILVLILKTEQVVDNQKNKRPFERLIFFKCCTMYL